MRYIAGRGEFKGVTRILMARRQRVHERLDLPFLYGPIWQGNRWRDPASPFKPVLNPNLIWYKHYFVGLIPNRDQLDAKSLPIEQSGRFRTEREPDRQRKNHKQRKTDSLHDIATGKRPDSVLEFVQLLELPADYIARRDLN